MKGHEINGHEMNCKKINGLEIAFNNAR